MGDLLCPQLGGCGCSREHGRKGKAGMFARAGGLSAGAWFGVARDQIWGPIAAPP